MTIDRINELTNVIRKLSIRSICFLHSEKLQLSERDSSKLTDIHNRCDIALRDLLFFAKTLSDTAFNKHLLEWNGLIGEATNFLDSLDN